MFVDACAIVSIISGEESRHDYDRALMTSPRRFTSPMAAWEAVMVLSRPEKLDLPLATTASILENWLQDQTISMEHPSAPAQDVFRHAIEVAQRIGVGKRRLSSLDCFHYAHAITAGAPMLTLDAMLRQTGLKTAPPD